MESKVAIYLRLSRLDRKKNEDESESIKNQEDLLKRFVKGRGWGVPRVYKDDGYSGSNYDRPDFERLIRDVENGSINVIVTKDMSRLGRDQAETVRLLKKYFPRKRVLYIAYLDGIETTTGTDMRIGVHAFVNEIKVTETSANTKAAKRMKAERGEFANSQAPYGYKKNPKNKNHLIIDEYASKIVRRIFTLYSEGNSARGIAEILNHEGVLSPSRYHLQQRGKRETAKQASVTWGYESVNNILRRKVYIGHMVSGMRTNISPLLKDRVQVPEDEWIIVENTHEPIIDAVLWERVQEKLSKQKGQGRTGRSTNSNGEVSLFKAKVFCADCGHQMNRTTNRSNGKAYIKYRCCVYGNYGKTACSYNAISEDELHRVVLKDIQELVAQFVDDEETLLNRLLALSDTERENGIQFLLKQVNRLIKEISAIELDCRNLIERHVKELVSDAMLKLLMSQNEEDLKRKHAELAMWEKKLADAKTKTGNTGQLIDKLKAYIHIQALDRSIVTELIDKIVVSKVSQESGEKSRKIEIYYNFIGQISKPLA